MEVFEHRRHDGALVLGRDKVLSLGRYDGTSQNHRHGRYIPRLLYLDELAHGSYGLACVAVYSKTSIMKLSHTTTFFDPYAVCRAANVRSGDTVVDLHCGHHGVCTLPVAELVGDDGRVYAVDARRSALESLRARAEVAGHGHVETVWGNAARTGGVPLDAELADVVLIVNGLSFLSEHLEVVKEAVRLLKSGGRLAVVDWKPTGTIRHGPHITRRLSDARARSTCLVTGLRYEGDVPVGPHHYAFICQKP